MINKIYSKSIGFQGKFYSAIRFLLRICKNLIFPLEIKLTKKQSLSGNDKIIVSLTSFPQRIDKVWMAIETIFRQTVKPDRIILTLSELQFPERKIPQKLIEQTQRGLEIIWTEDDLRSHKKYFYAMQKYPDAIIITIDDDILYEKSLLKKLLDFNKIYPDCIICNWGAIKKGSKYKEWENLLFQFKSPSYDVLQIGVGGVLYPSNSLDKEVFKKEVFLEICPLADDIWLNAMAVMNDTKVVKTDYSFYYIPILNENNFELNKVNVGENHNDVQIKKILDKYESLLKGRFFIH